MILFRSTSNTSLQDIQRQQQSQVNKNILFFFLFKILFQNEPKPRPQRQQTYSTFSDHSTAACGGIFQHSTSSPQSSSSSFWENDNQHSSAASKPAPTSANKPSYILILFHIS
jgi:hypothetical protein